MERNLIPRGAETLTHLRGIDRESQHLARDATFNLFNLRVNYDKAWTFHRVSEKISARFVGNLPPDPLHRFRFVQVDFCPSAQIDNETQVVIGKYPVNERMLLDLGDFTTPGGGQSVQVGKIIERHGGHPAGLRKSALINCAQNTGIVAL